MNCFNIFLYSSEKEYKCVVLLPCLNRRQKIVAQLYNINYMIRNIRSNISIRPIFKRNLKFDVIFLYKEKHQIQSLICAKNFSLGKKRLSWVMSNSLSKIKKICQASSIIQFLKHETTIRSNHDPVYCQNILKFTKRYSFLQTSV